MRFRAVLFIIGVLLSGLSLSMIIPCALEMMTAQIKASYGFLISFGITAFFGVALALANRPSHKIQLGTREAFITTTLTWITMCLFASLPFYCSALELSFIDSCFEAVSSLTTTGATILLKLEEIPSGILLWRSILQWLGGVGIVVMAMTIFPVLRIGGMQLFRSEFSDKSEKILPKVSQIASAILTAYICFTLLCLLLLWFAGMSFFDATCHAMTAISTGGLSTKTTSILAFNNPLIEMILCIFMFIGASALIIYVRLWNRDFSVFKDSQFRTYAGFTFFCILMMTSWFYSTQSQPFTYALRQSAFIVISFISSTGYVLSDYTQWGTFAMIMLFILSFVGGCTGSTSGGIKIFRFQVLYSLTKSHLRQLRRPHGVYLPLYDNVRITDVVAFSVFTFIVLYLLSIVLLALMLSLFGIDLLTCLSGAVSCLGNVGPGISKLISYDAHMGNLVPASKVVMMFGMLLGRLELLTMLVLFMPSFWRD